jgi:glutamine amidotransferase
MVEKVGGEAEIVTDPETLRDDCKIILAGVGAFDHGVAHLRDKGWIEALNEAVLVRKSPVLGICLGMQLMCNSSEEGKMAGLGWIDGTVKRFLTFENSQLKVPHMGWNAVKIVKPNPLIVDSEQRFYFVHSYHAVCNKPENVLATSYYGYELTTAFSHENIYGVQFHPEKSHRFGMSLMKNFVDLAC